MLSKSYKTLYKTEIRETTDEQGKTIQEEVQVPYKVLAYYKDGNEITEEEYNNIIASLPKPKQPTEDYYKAQARMVEIKSQLDALDIKEFKAIEALAKEGKITSSEALDEVTAQKDELRKEYNELEKVQ